MIAVWGSLAILSADLCTDCFISLESFILLALLSDKY